MSKKKHAPIILVTDTVVQYDHELFVDFFTLENHFLWFALTGFPH